MKFLKIIQLCILGILPLLSQAQQKYSADGETIEVPVYRLNTPLSYSLLNMGYASSEIKDPELWRNDNKIIKEIDIVFTAYPKKKEHWVTDYDWLLNQRIESLKKLEPTLANNKHIKWNFILQNSCDSEMEAQRMFHGVVIKYIQPTLLKRGTPIPSEQGETSTPEEINKTMESVVYGLSPFEDSVVFKTFNRNDWKKMLIVNDWTGSMYPYGAQAVLWHRINFERNAVKYFIFFNDGNQKLNRQKRIGNTGGIYYCKPDSIDYILKVMKLVAKRGHGGDVPENNIEALLKGIKLFKGYDQLVMIADNNAGVRDMILLEKVTVPVRVILCGLEKNQPVHPHYLEIARKTGGSIHTIEEDIEGLKDLKENDTVVISGMEYVIKKGKVVRQTKKQVVLPKSL